jgi:hypothetical protein
MELSREDSAKLLIKRANLLEWIAEAEAQAQRLQCIQDAIGYRIALQAVEKKLRRGGVQLEKGR